jgi:hypothetical protein
VTMDKAAAIVGDQLMPAAVRGLDDLCEAIDALEDTEIRAGLIFSVYFDRVQQREQGVTYTLDVAALDALSTAAEKSPAEVRDVALELPLATACEALGELIYLHREIVVTTAIAAESAAWN